MQEDTSLSKCGLKNPPQEKPACLVLLKGF